MRKPLAILLIAIHLTGNTEVGQFLKFPQLLVHFFQHHQLDPSISFFEFIAMHYGGDDGITADDDIDNQLPYHNMNHTTIAVTFSPMVKEIQLERFYSWHNKEYNSLLKSGIASAHVLLILQPPRLA
jgi:hypothetical protein